MKQPALTDVSVLILFFNRPQYLKQVFEQVRKARPARLFLYQDGARNEKDMPGIEECRRIVAEVDWECEVHTLFQERNYGCDPSEYLSQKWAFSLTDKCIVLEDDDVPALSFFTFCKEMLDKYEFDERITMISGFNEDETTSDICDSYFFSSTFAIWGWASWRRVIDKWEADYAFLDDKQTVTQLTNVIRQRRYRSDFLPMCINHRASGKEYYESIFWSSMLLQSGLAIVPSKNMINNLGLSDDSTHFSGSMKTTPRVYRRIFTMKRFEMDFPLKHPKYVIDHVAYKERLYLTNAWGHPLIKVGRSLEELWLNLRYGNFKAIGKAVLRRIRIWLGTEKHA